MQRLTRRGRAVDPTLQTPQRADVFSAGDAAAVPDLAKGEGAITPPTAQHAQRQGVVLAHNIARSLRGQALEDYRHRDLGLVVDLGGARSVARPLGRELSGLPAQVVTRGYHLGALPSLRSRTKAAVSWLTHAGLGDDFIRVGSPDSSAGTLEADEGHITYLSGEQAAALSSGLPRTPD